MTLRVVLADDEHLIRSGLRTLLERDGIEVVAEAADGVEAIASVREYAPDVALFDVRMPLLDGIEAAGRLSADPSVTTRLVILTTFDDDQTLLRALRAGAAGYLLKAMPALQLTAAVRAAASGDVLLAPRLVQRLLDHKLDTAARAERAEGVRALLSPRELDVLMLVATGRNNEEIARDMFVGVATVKTHISALLSKLGCRDRVQLVVRAHDSGLVPSRSADRPS